MIIWKEEIKYNKMEYIITAEFMYENYNNPNIMELFTEVVYYIPSISKQSKLELY